MTPTLKTILARVATFVNQAWTNDQARNLYEWQGTVESGPSIIATFMSHHEAPSSATPPVAVPFAPPMLVLALGLIAISFSAILIRMAQNEAPSLVIAAARLAIAALILLPFALARRQQELRALAAADWRLALLSGFFLSIHFASWISSLEYTTVASSTILVTTSPLWVGLASPFVLGEPVPRWLKVGIVLAMAGSIIISFDQPAGFTGDQTWLGNGLALIGALAASVYFLIGRRLRPHLSLLSYTAVVYGTAALFLIGYVLASGQSFLGYSAGTYWLFLLMALFPQLMGHTSYNWALGFLPAAYVIVTIVSEPAGAGLLAFLFFGELPGKLTFAGSLIIISGIIIAGRRPRNPSSPRPDR